MTSGHLARRSRNQMATKNTKTTKGCRFTTKGTKNTKDVLLRPAQPMNLLRIRLSAISRQLSARQGFIHGAGINKANIHNEMTMGKRGW